MYGLLRKSNFVVKIITVVVLGTHVVSAPIKGGKILKKPIISKKAVPTIPRIKITSPPPEVAKKAVPTIPRIKITKPPPEVAQKAVPTIPPLVITKPPPEFAEKAVPTIPLLEITTPPALMMAGPTMPAIEIITPTVLMIAGPTMPPIEITTPPVLMIAGPTIPEDYSVSSIQTKAENIAIPSIPMDLNEAASTQPAIDITAVPSTVEAETSPVAQEDIPILQEFYATIPADALVATLPPPLFNPIQPLFDLKTTERPEAKQLTPVQSESLLTGTLTSQTTKLLPAVGSDNVSFSLIEPLSQNKYSDLSFLENNSNVQSAPNSERAMTDETAQTNSVSSQVYPSNVDLKNLYEFLLTGYDTRVRPKSNQSQTTQVSVFFSILNVLDFKTSSQTFDILGYFYFVWEDDFLTWKPREYSRLQWTKIPQPEIWTPQVMIANMYSGESRVGDSTDRVLVTFRGTVSWVPESTYKIICEVEIEYYPFDKQTCRLTFYVSDEFLTEVELVPDAKHNGVRIDNYIENSEWKLINATVDKYSVYGVSYIDVIFVVERRLEFIFFTTIAPLLLLSVMNVCAFLIPVESEEKGSYSITIVITYGVFISHISASLPPNSMVIPYMLLYMIWLLGFSVSTVIYSVIQSRLFAHYSKRIVRLKSFIKCFGKTNKVSSKHDNTSTADLSYVDETTDTQGSNLLCGDILRKLDGLMIVLYLISISGTTAYVLVSMKLANKIV